MKILDTDRLALYEFTLDDAPFVFELMNTPTWIQFIGDRGIKTLEDAKKYILDKLIKSYADNGFGLYLVKLKEENKSIGMCGLVNRPTLDDVDIGFALMPEYEGNGFGYESATAVLKYAKKELNLKKIVAITVSENQNSIKLLQRIGLHFEKMIDSDGEELMLFST